MPDAGGQIRIGFFETVREKRFLCGYGIFSCVLVFNAIVSHPPCMAKEVQGIKPQNSSHVRLSGIVNGKTKVRVKIFPHKKRYPPHEKDRMYSQVKLESAAPCSLFRGLKDYPGSDGSMVLSGSSFEFSSKNFTHPLWLECSSVVKLVRKRGLPSFEYSGGLYIHMLQDDELEVINVVSLSEYLEGVVPSEVSKGWTREALRTQAVAARSYAVFHLIFSRIYLPDRLYDVDDTIQFQVFTGRSILNETANLAIRDTEDEVLTYKNSVVQAYYHADSGGYTEDAMNVWGFDVPFVEGRMEPFYEKLGDPFVWEKEIDLEKFSKKLVSLKILPPGGRVDSLTVPADGRTRGQRVQRVAAMVKGGGQKNISIQVFRQIVPNLPSMLFDIVKNDGSDKKSTFLVKGKGIGHGVGMNQRGARLLAESEGWPYDRILKFYYGGTDICRLSSGMVKNKRYPECIYSPSASKLEPIL
ncbi:MAG: SpoIID/LytB domain-containing protein [Oligoflexales bacterium]|nr:SpoIID/LytB domain-containing protein [Oligoflexales bacterium]